jgi:hypothetical protein
MTSYKPPFPFRSAFDANAPPVLGAQNPPTVSYFGTVDANGFNKPVFQVAGTGTVSGVGSLNGALGNVVLSGSGFSVSNVAGAFTVENTGVLSVAAGTGGVTIGGTAQAPTISATATTLSQDTDVVLGGFTGSQFSADSVFLSPFITLTPGVYLLTFSWDMPYTAFGASATTYSFAELYRNGTPSGEFFKTTLVDGMAATAGGQPASFFQTVTGIISLSLGDQLRYNVVMTNSTFTNNTVGSTFIYSAVQLA